MVARRSRVSFLVRAQPPVPFTAVAALRPAVTLPACYGCNRSLPLTKNQYDIETEGREFLLNERGGFGP
jgi:hypothetical protein